MLQAKLLPEIASNCIDPSVRRLCVGTRVWIIVLVSRERIPLLPHWPAWMVMISLDRRQQEQKSYNMTLCRIIGEEIVGGGDVPGHLDHCPLKVVEVRYRRVDRDPRGNFRGFMPEVSVYIAASSYFLWFFSGKQDVNDIRMFSESGFTSCHQHSSTCHYTVHNFYTPPLCAISSDASLSHGFLHACHPGTSHTDCTDGT